MPVDNATELWLTNGNISIIADLTTEAMTKAVLIKKTMIEVNGNEFLDEL